MNREMNMEVITNTQPASAQAVMLNTLDDTIRLADIFIKSGFFKDSQQAAQAVTKMMLGRELQVGPVSAMLNIHIIEGKPSVSASLAASMIKRSGRYNYSVVQDDDTGCVLTWTDKGTPVGRSSFLQEDAKRAGLLTKQNWQRYPRDMYFARALTQGARRYCADIFLGAIYDPEELGADNVGPITATEAAHYSVQIPTVPQPQPQPQPQPTTDPQTGEIIPPATNTYTTNTNSNNGNGTRRAFAASCKRLGLSVQQRQEIVRAFSVQYNLDPTEEWGDEQAHTLVALTESWERGDQAAEYVDRFLGAGHGAGGRSELFAPEPEPVAMEPVASI